MTKDEARARLERHLGFAWDAGTKGGKDGINHGMKLADAYAQAAVDAFKADTLGMLEEMAKLGDDPVFKGLQVNYCPNADTFTYFNHRPRSSIAFQRDRDISRVEAEALLGKGQRHGRP